MYTVDRLLDDVLLEKGALKRGQPAEKGHYQQVWDAFNRYITATLDRRQTLEVPNFCKIGWRVEECLGKVKHRPHFQLAESFVRVHQLDANRQTTIPDSQLTQIEDFNYSKAAIKYSQGLTKAHMFAGLRAIVHKIGEACSRQKTSIEFEMGQLLCSERIAHFAFVGDLYQQEGLEVPKSALADMNYHPSCTFAPATAEGLSLAVRGRRSSEVSARTPSVASSQASSRHVGFVRSREHPQEDADATSTCTTSECSAKARVRQDHLERHLEDVQADAEEAMAKHTREGHFRKECENFEGALANSRRAFYADHKEELRRQMQQKEEKRQEGRQNAIAQSSQHDFPSFREDPPTSDVREYMHERKHFLREDLDEQVSLKRSQKDVANQKDKTLTAREVECNKLEVQRQKDEQAAKKERERSILAEAWDRSIRLKLVEKAIAVHHMTSARKETPNFTAALRSIPALALPQQRLHTGSSLSSRRAPLGAAASLALHRDRQPSSARG